MLSDPTQVCRKKGRGLHESKLFGAHAAIHQPFQELKQPFNLFKSEVFAESSRVFDAALKKNKGNGLEPSVFHKEALSVEDRD